ncbi:linker histone H1 and H5 family protein [Cooperia oncophora]
MSTDVAAGPSTIPRIARPKLHPPYSEMVHKAIAELKDRSGSSKAAILRYLVQNYQLGDNVNKINTNIRLALKKGVEKGELKQVTGTGATGSFKLGEKKAAAPKVKKPVAKRADKEAAPAAVKKEKAAAPKKKVEKKVEKAEKAPKEKKAPAKASAAPAAPAATAPRSTQKEKEAPAAPAPKKSKSKSVKSTKKTSTAKSN